MSTPTTPPPPDDEVPPFTGALLNKLHEAISTHPVLVHLIDLVENLSTRMDKVEAARQLDKAEGGGVAEVHIRPQSPDELGELAGGEDSAG